MSFSLVQSPLFGGVRGGYFNDLVSLGYPGQSALNLNHPITNIGIFSGFVVDGISFTYNLANGTQVTQVHGTKPNVNVALGANEYIQSIIGRAGFQSYYKASLVSQLTFVIVDNSTLAIRTAGPFGNSNKANEGSAFAVSNPIAASGYAQSDTDTLGLGGLSFARTVSN